MFMQASIQVVVSGAPSVTVMSSHSAPLTSQQTTGCNFRGTAKKCFDENKSQDHAGLPLPRRASQKVQVDVFCFLQVKFKRKPKIVSFPTGSS